MLTAHDSLMRKIPNWVFWMEALTESAVRLQAAALEIEPARLDALVAERKSLLADIRTEIEVAKLTAEEVQYAGTALQGPLAEERRAVEILTRQREILIDALGQTRTVKTNTERLAQMYMAPSSSGESRGTTQLIH